MSALLPVLLQAHSGGRYLVLAVGVLAAAYLTWGAASTRPFDALAHRLSLGFMIALDVQTVLGVALVAVFPWYPALAGHLLPAALAVAAVHGFRVAFRKATTDARRWRLAALSVVVPLALALVGIVAIGRRIV